MPKSFDYLLLGSCMSCQVAPNSRLAQARKLFGDGRVAGDLARNSLLMTVWGVLATWQLLPHRTLSPCKTTTPTCEVLATSMSRVTWRMLQMPWLRRFLGNIAVGTLG